MADKQLFEIFRRTRKVFAVSLYRGKQRYEKHLKPSIGGALSGKYNAARFDGSKYL
jgi:hypothetical protein